MARILVVGAGMAGLRAAGALSGAHRVVVVDKGRGVGGRMAHRRGDGGAAYDHGAQFFTARHDDFAADVAGWERAGLVEVWHRSLLGPAGAEEDDGHPRYRGAPSMTAVPKHLAAGLDVLTGVRVTRLVATGDGWAAQGEGVPGATFDAVVLTPPVPQSLDLLPTTVLPAEVTADLTGIVYDRCLAVLVALDGPSGLPEPGAVRPGGEPVEWVADNQRKGVSATPTVTVHLGPAASETWWDQPADEVAALAMAAVGEHLQARPRVTSVHRWRYSRPQTVHDQRAVLVDGPAPLVFAGDAFGAPLVEGAARSGSAAADLLATRLGS